MDWWGVDWLALATIVVVGFVGCAEFASVALVHPVIRRLDPDDQLVFEKGLLRTFGRIMPVGMTLAVVLAIDSASGGWSGAGWVIAAAVIVSVALVVTILGNVPINIRTGRIDADAAPEGFIAMRRRWDVYQFVRGSLQLVGFLLLAVGLVGV
jgi:hypothetical protein